MPDIFVTEVVATLVRRANMDKVLRREMGTAIGRFVAMFEQALVRVTPLSAVTTAQAAETALDVGHPLKDCLYLQLAMDSDCPLITCDAKFAAKVHSKWPRVHILGE